MRSSLLSERASGVAEAHELSLAREQELFDPR